jgi:chromo domain-containing protein 1
MEHDCIEIFPALGGFIFITDEVFESKPQVALKIVKLFCDKVEKVRQLDGPTSSYHKVVAPLWWRLYVQPELMENLIEQSEARERKFGISDPDVQAYVHQPPSE